MKAEPGAEAREVHYEGNELEKARPDFSPDGSPYGLQLISRQANGTAYG